MKVTHTHSQLNAIAVRWLLRAASSKGASCHVAFQEVSDTSGTERCDAWGYSWGWRPFSVLVEVKVSRSDFLRDKHKPHRQQGGVGTYRYYMCPEGLLTVEDMPERWGLIWVNSRGHCRIMAGAACCHISEGYHGGWIEEQWKHTADQVTELNMLAYMFKRVGDPDALLQQQRANAREITSLKAQNAEQAKQLKQYRRDVTRYSRMLDAIPRSEPGDMLI